MGNTFFKTLLIEVIINQLTKFVQHYVIAGIAKSKNVVTVEDDSMSNQVQKWINATIPYEFDDSLCKYF